MSACVCYPLGITCCLPEVPRTLGTCLLNSVRCILLNDCACRRCWANVLNTDLSQTTSRHHLPIREAALLLACGRRFRKPFTRLDHFDMS